MSEAVLVQIISLLCSQSIATHPLQPNSHYIQEARIECFEKYTNCAIGLGGKILTIKEFNQKCVKESK